MISAQFDNVGGVGAGMALKNLVKGVPFGTELQLLAASGGYDLYYYIEEAYDEDTDNFIEGWADGGDNLATIKFAPGTAFWLKTPADCSANIAGQILSDASKVVSVAAGQYSMIANPYPMAVNPNEIGWTGLSYNDEMQVLADVGGYDLYYYIEEAYDEVADDFVEGWADGGDNLIVDPIIPVGQGAWLKPTSAVTIEWSKPIK